jgi:three-Cys-motif partner protein
MAQDGDTFFQEQKDWSKRKLEIIESYLASFTKILGSSTSESCVYYVDGFAGKGIYEDGAKGSPLLAIDLAKKYRDEHKKYQLNCINVEENEGNFANLELATAQFAHLAENFEGTFASNIDKILLKIGSCPAFFFIDPFGVKGTNWADMVKIISRQAPTDLWLRFDHRTVRRLSGFFDSGSRGADSKVQRLLRLYGIQRADNLFQLLDGRTPEDRIDKAVNFYVERLKAEFQKGKKGNGYSASFPIISLAGQNKYYLVFAASLPKAVILANETVYSVERNRPQEMQEYTQKKTGQPFLFSAEPTEKEILSFIAEELIPDIWRVCSGKHLTRTDIYLELLNDNKKKWFGRFSGSNLTKALMLLEKEPNPRIIQRSGAISQDKTVFTFRPI